MRSGIKSSAALVAAAFALIIPLWLVPADAAVTWVKNYGYYGIAFTVAAFLVVTAASALNGIRRSKPHAKSDALGIAVVGLATVFLNTQSNREFNILFDEHTLSATAMSMHDGALVYAPVAAHYYQGELLGSAGFVDKRPLLFPFLLSLVHDLAGFRPENVYLLNTILSAILLSLLYLAISRSAGPTYGALAVLIFSSLPLLAQNATGGGYELLNLCLILGLLISTSRYLKDDSHVGSLSAMVMTSVLLANTRYESILYVLVPVGAFCIKSLRAKRIQLSWFAAASPLFLILPLMTFNLFQAEPGFIQTEKENFFSPQHIPGNLAHAIAYLFEPTGKYTNSVLLSAMGCGAAALFINYALRRARDIILRENEITALLLISAVIFATTVLAISHYWGAWTDPATPRFSLPLQLLFALTIPLVLKHVFRIARAPAWLLFAVGLFCIFVSRPNIARMDQENRLKVAEGYTWAIDWVKNRAPAGEHLYLADSAIGIGLQRVAAIPFNAANAMPERVMLARELGIYDEIFVFQMLSETKGGENMRPVAMRPLSPRFQLEKVAQVSQQPGPYYRISRVISLHGGAEESGMLPKNLPPEKPKGPLDQDALIKYYQSVLPITASELKRSPSDSASKD